MIGLIGPDGVGKSTLLALLAGVRRIQTGEVGRSTATCATLDIAPLAPRASPICRRVSAAISIRPLSVVENLDFFGRLFGQARAEREARIAELLSATGLDPFPDRPAGQVVRRHETEALAVLRVDPRSGPADSR